MRGRRGREISHCCSQQFCNPMSLHSRGSGLRKGSAKGNAIPKVLPRTHPIYNAAQLKNYVVKLPVSDRLNVCYIHMTPAPIVGMRTAAATFTQNYQGDRHSVLQANALSVLNVRFKLGLSQIFKISPPPPTKERNTLFFSS